MHQKSPACLRIASVQELERLSDSETGMAVSKIPWNCRHIYKLSVSSCIRSPVSELRYLSYQDITVSINDGEEAYQVINYNIFSIMLSHIGKNRVTRKGGCC